MPPRALRQARLCHASLIAAVALASGGAARAENAIPLPGAKTSLNQLALHPERFAGRRIVWNEGYCFADDATFVCIGADQPFEVVAPRLSPSNLQGYLKENCGGMDAIERNPFPQCSAQFSFVVGHYETVKGDYVLHGELQSDKHIVRFHSSELSISRR
jgi:hypothetical protein